MLIWKWLSEILKRWDLVLVLSLHHPPQNLTAPSCPTGQYHQVGNGFTKKNLTGQYLQVSIAQKRSHRAISQYPICINYICITYTQFHRAISTSTVERTTVKKFFHGNWYQLSITLKICFTGQYHQVRIYKNFSLTGQYHQVSNKQNSS